MLAINKTAWEMMTDKNKVEYLIDELKSIKEVASYHFKENAGSRPKQTGIEACTWITNEVNGLLKIIE